MEKIVPNSALKFYTSMYCRRKGEPKPSNDRVKEATKSWLSLTEEEQKYFVSKFEDHKQIYKNKFADYLKSTKPYVKKKALKTRIDQNPNVNDSTAENITLTSENNFNYSDTKTTTGPFGQEDQPNSPQEDAEEWLHSVLPRLPEPIPPNVKSGKELFELINEMDEENKNTWSSLSISEQRSYQAVVLALKKDYLNKYKDYLDMLSSENLYEHYKAKVEQT